MEEFKENSYFDKINILVVGSGAREHALAWKLSHSPRTKKIYVAPGNPGLGIITKLTPIKVDDLDGLINFALELRPGLVVIGPEAPLAAGLVDHLAAIGLKVFGPLAAAARLETSKVFAKQFMARHGIPTAAWASFTSVGEALRYLEGLPDGPIVVKVAGLAAGKGVTVARDRGEAVAAVRAAMEERCFGVAGEVVIIEDYLEGEEVSVLCFTDGRTIIPMPAVQDHKRLGEGDNGPNTGGMGAYSPVSAYTSEVAAQVERTIINPTLAGLKVEGLDFRGCLYCGLMLPAPGSPYQGPQVIEYNARFGDPEAQVLVSILKSDLVEIMLACAGGTLAGQTIEWCDETSVAVVIVSGGYPGDFATGLVVTEKMSSRVGASLIFHGGTAANQNGEIVTSGGRVMTIVARDLTLEKALLKAYDRVGAVHFKNSYYRRDIGYRELARRRLTGG